MQAQDVRHICALVDGKIDTFTDLSDAIWRVPELGFQEYQSAALLIRALEDEGFAVERGVAGMETAFIASYGAGAPVIGLLAEYDALPGLSQTAALPEKRPLIEGGPGHGCGHNALGAAVVAAAVAVKDYLAEHPQSGTVRVYGCPGEEAGWGKMFMARDGIFDGVDACYTWHPGNVNAVQGYSSTANICAYFTFRGKSSHAAAAPHLGRSAVDACELMNVGVNYMREHIPPEARVHYAYQNAGGKAPNVVHDTACLKYYVRAPKTTEAKRIVAWIKEIAQGAAMMTQTQCIAEVTAGMSDFVVNDAVSLLMAEALREAGPPDFDEADEALAKSFRDRLTEQEKKAGMLRVDLSYTEPERFSDTVLIRETAPFMHTPRYVSGSTDVGDVSYVVPTGQLWITCYANGTPGHSWQVTAQCASSITHKAIASAAKTLALSTVMSFKQPDVLTHAWAEHRQRTGGVYECPVDRETKPRLP